MYEDKKERIIQEFVPGKQVTLAHVIPHPVESLYGKMGLIDAQGAIGIFTITPSEAAIIAADVASKAADIQIGFVDRFNGSLIITGCGSCGGGSSRCNERAVRFHGICCSPHYQVLETGGLYVQGKDEEGDPYRKVHGRKDYPVPVYFQTGSEI